MKVSNPMMKHFVRTTNRALEVLVTPDQYDRAEKRAKELGILNNSITQGKSNGWGMLGEEIIRDLLNCTESDDIYNYDLKTPGGMRLEIKTKKPGTDIQKA